MTLSDDLWLEIDHNDNESIKQGVTFKSDFNQRNSQFTTSANLLSELIQNYTNVPLYSQDQDNNSTYTFSERERIIKELNKKEAHSLKEDFKYKRPFGFVLEDTAYTNKFTWSEVYTQICAYLQIKKPHLFSTLENNADHISNRNNKYFSSKPNDLRSPQRCGSLIYIEMNLSANGIRDSIRRLLSTFSIHESKISHLPS